MVIKIVSKIVKITRSSAFILLLLIIFTLYTLYSLVNGIKIDKLYLDIITIEKLYIKLDKKLILTAKKIDIGKSTNSNSSLEQIEKIITNFELIIKLFKEIDIEELNLNQESISILYRDGLFYIDSKYLNLTTLFGYDESRKALNFDIKALALKDYSIYTSGVAKLNLKDENLEYEGEYIVEEVFGNIYLLGDERGVDLQFNSPKLANIDTIRDLIPLSDAVKAWIFDKTKAKSYKLDYLTLKIDSDFNVDINSIFAKVTLNSPKVYFDPKLSPITDKKIEVIFNRGDMHFKLNSPKYKGISLNGSQVAIENLLEKPLLNILILSNSRFNRDISNILLNYGVDLELTQLSYFLKSIVNLKLDLESLNFNYRGVVEFSDDEFIYQRERFKLESGYLILNGSNIYLQNARLKYQNLLDTEVDMKLDLSKEVVTGELEISKFILSEDERDVVEIENLKTPFKITSLFSFFNLEFPELEIKFTNYSDKSFLNIANLSKLYSYSNLLKKLNIEKGSLKISTSNFKHINILANLKDLKTPLYKDGKFLKDLGLKVKLSPKDMQISTLTRDIVAYIKREITLNIANYDIFLPSVAKLTDSSSKESLKLKKKLRVDSKYTNLYFGDKVILSDEFNLVVDDSNIDFRSKFQNSIIKFKKRGERLLARGDNLSYVFLQSYFQKDFIEGGLYSFEMSSYSDLYKFQIGIQNVTIKNLALLNNLLAFIDTIPSILTFKKLGFSEKGYEVERGEVDFIYFKDNIYVREFKLKGRTIDFYGSGVIYPNENRIDLRVTMTLVKNLSRVIQNIPLVGYVILGDGTISTNIDITGALDNPKIETNILKDTFSAPANILKRTFSLPKKFLDFLESEN